jgi:hypothetical protein
VIEIWDDKEAFEEFLRTRLGPANEALGIKRTAKITVKPLHKLFSPRLNELPGAAGHLPGAQAAQAA